MSTTAALPNFATMTPEQIAAFAAEQYSRAQRLSAQVNKPKSLKMKVGEKGGIVISGTRARFPLSSPYAEEAKLMGTQIFGLTDVQFDESPIGQFIAANRDSLKFKNPEE